MKRSLVLFFAILLLFACTKTVPKVATEPAARRAIEVQYVAVPSLAVHTEPRAESAVITTYGMNETVSILARQGDWVEVRTVEGSGWANSKELMTSDQAKALEENPTPRFLNPPAPIPDTRARGEISLEAKVNTDGEVTQVKIGKNTTKNAALAAANANSLMQARFYPMVQKGQRMTFTYEHKVYY